MWYDLTPAAYAIGLRFNAARNDECAAYQATAGKPWSTGEAERYRRQARRLRAMALLCDCSTEARAGSVDFLGMNKPNQTRDEESAAVAQVEQLAV